jgi:hypothetical protein
MATGPILASNRGRINVPSGPFLDERGNITPAWRIWLLNPNVQSLQAAAPLEPYSGGLGVSTTPAIGQLPVATSTGVYTPSAFTSLPLFTSTSPGLAPASGGGTVNFLRADGTYASPVAGSPTQVQYNSSGTFAASPLFTYTASTNVLGVGNITGTALAMQIQPKAPTVLENAGSVSVTARTAALANGNGGGVAISTGNGLGTGTGGPLTLSAGNGPGGGAGGDFTMTAGASTNGTGGAFNVFGGNGSTQGGGVIMFAGPASGAGGTGGAVTFAAGAGGTGGTGGTIQFSTGFAPSGTSGVFQVLVDDGLSPAFTADDDGLGGGARIAFYSATPKTQAAAYTQTYTTAARTVPNATFTNLATTAAVNVSPWGFATQAQADAIATKVNALGADVLLLKQLINSLINDCSATLGVGLNAT